LRAASFLVHGRRARPARDECGIEGWILLSPMPDNADRDAGCDTGWLKQAGAFEFVEEDAFAAVDKNRDSSVIIST
jgi:hypothetical protein